MSKQSIRLSGQWDFKPCSLDEKQVHCSIRKNDWMRVTVPGSVFGSLMEAGRIDPLDMDANPENYKWVSESGWIYRKEFNLSDELSMGQRVDLVFDGLDTIAEILLNGKLVGTADNMFIPFRFDVTKFLTPGNNSLVVKFAPAKEYGRICREKYDRPFVAAERAFIRKSQYQFGWDWCPPLEGCGIWRDVRLEGIKEGRIDSLHIRTVDIRNGWANIEVAAELDRVRDEAFLCKIILSCGKQVVEKAISFKSGQNSKTISIRIDNPKLWHPRGYGKQNLYRLQADLICKGEIVHHHSELFGIRTIKLNRRKDAYGEKFEFEVNGRPVYIRGASWVPASMFPGSVANTDYEALLNAAAEGNINMLRVWGGGYYENDLFYRLCDRLGIMVWQDFMFACAYYPDSEGFQKQVKAEGAAAIKRLRNHPSIGVWCGNNEIDWIHSQKWFGKCDKFYGKAIYHRILPRLMADLAAGHNYIPTTPVASEDSADPNDPGSGAVHQWNVWNFNAPARDYLTPEEKIPRFVAEFGLQSLPSIETIKEFCPPDQVRIGSRAIDKHDYQERNSRIYRYIGNMFGSPSNIEDFSYLSQLTQARAIKWFVEHLRSHNFINSGVMFWQFNDACMAVSWAAVDYKKRPKALYYYAKRFYADVLVTAIADPKSLTPGSRDDFKLTGAIAINDSDKQVKAELKYCVMDLFGNPIKKGSAKVQIDPFSRSAVLPLPAEIASAKDSEKRILHLAMENKNGLLAENLLLLTYDKYIEWPVPKVTSKIKSLGAGKWKLIIKSNTVVKDLHISTGGKGTVSDNFIDMLPGREYEIAIKTAANERLEESSIKFNFIKLGGEER
jgi:beta-mannosidase